MQRLLALTLSDPMSVGRFHREHPELLGVARDMTAGGWGLGFWGSGEMLVRKCPITERFDSDAILDQVQARQLVLVADSESALRSTSTTMQPLRFRDWLFAMAGGPAEVDPYLSRAKDAVEGFTRAAWTVPDLTMMVIMETLYRRNLLDGGRGTTGEPLRQGLAAAIARVVELSGGRESASVAVVLHIAGHVFAFSAGRALTIGEIEKPPASRRDKRGARALVVTDQELEGDPLEWAGVEVLQNLDRRAIALPEA